MGSRRVTLPLTLDYREDDIETMATLMELVYEDLVHIRKCHPEVYIGSVTISEHQLKMLRLECYEQGMPEEDVKIMEPDMVCDLPVMVIWDDGTYRCLDCRQLHEVEEG